MTEEELIKLIDSRIERAFDVWVMRACKIEGERIRAIVDRKPKPTLAELNECYRSTLEWFRYFAERHPNPFVREQSKESAEKADEFHRVIEPRLRKLMERQR
jgi:hypothetical protein